MILLRLLVGFLFLPHLVLFATSKNKALIVKDLYKKNPAQGGMLLLLDLARTLYDDKYFRSLFYFRIANLGAKVLRVFYPKHPSFIIDIHTQIKGGVHLAHPYSTIINAESIGENLYINHLVTIGEKNGRRPILGDNVELHANAIVIGGITVGDKAVIGAGAVVTKDVPPGGVVVGNPARVIKYVQQDQ